MSFGAFPRSAVLAACLLMLASAPAQADTLARATRARAATVAAFDGLWCGTGLLRDFALRLSQQQQDVQGTLVRHDRSRTIEGHVEGSSLHTQATRHGSLVLERAGDELRVTGGDGALALARGSSFQRASGASCAG